jgi:hypothetical protein
LGSAAGVTAGAEPLLGCVFGVAGGLGFAPAGGFGAAVLTTAEELELPAPFDPLVIGACAGGAAAIAGGGATS